MNRECDLEVAERGSRRIHKLVVISLVLLVTAAHWWTPRVDEYSLVAHVALRKCYIIPVVLAALWFDLLGAILIAGLATLLYVPHVAIQWRGESTENINQVGEIITIWATAILSGVFAKREKAHLKRVASAYEGTVRALVMALDIREHDTEQHSLRVRAFTVRLSKQLGIAIDQRRVYGLAALLHDIGKIGIPDAILLKPAGLNEIEWSQMRKHPELGARILALVPSFGDVSSIVLSHHEKFDGTGYPKGLSGTRIPFGSRIFAVADVFDALTSTRPYKEPLTYDAARSTILEGSGRHFDPVVVEAFSQIPSRDWTGIRDTIYRDSVSIQKRTSHP